MGVHVARSHQISEECEGMKCRCNNCMRMFRDDSELELSKDGDEWFKGCPDCKTDGYLMDVEEAKR